MRRLARREERADFTWVNMVAVWDAAEERGGGRLVYQPLERAAGGETGARLSAALREDAESHAALPGALERVGVGDLEGRPAIVYAPFEGTPLKTLLDTAASAPWPATTAARAGAAACAALARRPRPDPRLNLLLAPDGSWRRLPSLDAVHRVEAPFFTAAEQLWPVGVAPPELLLGLEEDARAAALQVAALVVQLATGRRPLALGPLAFAQARAGERLADPAALEGLVPALARALAPAFAPHATRCGVGELGDRLWRV